MNIYSNRQGWYTIDRSATQNKQKGGSIWREIGQGSEGSESGGIAYSVKLVCTVGTQVGPEIAWVWEVRVSRERRRGHTLTDFGD